jgi:glycosyltransferase involved in cell wall biosynthesis
MRNLARKVRGLCKETPPTFQSEADALRTIITIRQSWSWELTAPLRLVHKILARRRRLTPAIDRVTPHLPSIAIGVTPAVSQPSRRSDDVRSPKPLISVIIPSYNHAIFVAQAIESVAAQDHGNVELIVIDDGSSDDSLNVIEEALKRCSSLRCELHTQQNRGAHAAINRGLDIARGEYLSILNSDDYYYPNRISKLLSFMREGDYQFAFSEVDHVGPDGHKLPDTNQVRFGYLSAMAALPQFPTVGFLLLLYNVTVTSGNFLIQRSLFEKVGWFEPYRTIHDWDFVLRVLVEAEPGFIREPLMGYRVHENNTLAKWEKEGRSEGPELIAKYFQSVSHGRATNRLAPTAYNWPHYFDWFVRNYPNDGTHRLVDFVPAEMSSLSPARCD